MLHQPIELATPSAAESRRRMARGADTVAAAARQPAEQTAILIEAIDEAFATMPHPTQSQQPTDSGGTDQTTDLRRHTDSLAEMLSGQLRELDEQRIRLLRLLTQIDSGTSKEATSAPVKSR